MNILNQLDTNLSLLDAALGSPEEYKIAQIEESLRKSGSTWIPVEDRNYTAIKRVWYAQTQDGKAYLTSERYAKSEIYLANWIKSRNLPDSIVPLVSTGLTNEQSSAARICLSSKISCISGLPGTGKTYTCRSIAESFSRYGMRVIGCALTGIASSRLKESAQIESTTIHRLLGWRGTKAGFTEKEIPADVIIVDECSMLDNQLLLSLVSRVKKESRLVLIGDPNQLPSIEPSDCFRELCSVLPHASLKEVLRRESDSPIGHAAQAILAGSVPQNEDCESGDGGVYILQCNNLSITESNRSQHRERNHPLTVAERMAYKDGTELRFIRTMASTNEAVSRLNLLFTLFKKVRSEAPIMCVKNNHLLEIYNGDIGYKEWRGQRFGDRFLSLPQHQVTDAWATTVHKIQGQECRSAQLWIEPSLTIRAAYTALTRAKSRFCFVGNVGTLERCLHTEEEPRITLLSGLINGTVRYTDTTQ